MQKTGIDTLNEQPVGACFVVKANYSERKNIFSFT